VIWELLDAWIKESDARNRVAFPATGSNAARGQLHRRRELCGQAGRGWTNRRLSIIRQDLSRDDALNSVLVR
jgi:hypothetical protein